MHIGFLTPEYPTRTRPEGGLANYLRKTGHYLAKYGHDISIFVSSNEDYHWKDELIDVYEVGADLRSGVIKAVPCLRIANPFVQRIVSARSLAKKVWKVHSQKPIDLLQASSYKAPGFSLLRNDKIPLICRISSYTPLWRSANGRNRNFIDYFCDWLEVRQIMNADASFVPSIFLADSFERIKGYRPRVIRTPLDTIDPMKMDSTFYAEHFYGKDYLLFFGTLNGIKGADLLADVLPNILSRYEKLNFVLIGRDDGLANGEKIFKYILNNCNDFKGRLIHYPPLPRNILSPIIANSLGVIMPSRVDNYPNACLEALSLGVPVIGTYDSSLEEMVCDGRTGFLAKNGNISSITEAIEHLINQAPEKRIEMKRNIYAAVDVINSEDRVGQLIDFYENIIDNFLINKNHHHNDL